MKQRASVVLSVIALLASVSVARAVSNVHQTRVIVRGVATTQQRMERSDISPIRPISGRGAAGSSGPYLVRFSDAARASRARYAVEPIGETDVEPRRTSLDMGAYPEIFKANILKPSEASISDNDISSFVRRSRNAQHARRFVDTVNNTFNDTPQQDVAGASNGTYIVMQNATGNIDVWTLAGSLVSSTSDNALFCSSGLPICSENPQLVDVLVQYDVQSSRFVLTADPLVSAMDAAEPVIIAVSTSSNPLGSYYLYQFSSCGGQIGNQDQPFTGFSAQYIALSVACHTGYPNLTMINKSTMYAGGTMSLNSTFWQTSDPFNVAPTQVTPPRDQPVLTYVPTINNRLYLVSAGTSNGDAELIYSHIEQNGTAPMLYHATSMLPTTFAAGTPVFLDSPGCQGCIDSGGNARVLSTGVWNFNNGQANIVSTVVMSDPRYARSDQAIEGWVNTSTGSSGTLQLAGGLAGAGMPNSEIAMPLVANTSFNASMIVYERSRADFYPGIYAAQWNMDSKSLVYVSDFEQGTFTPTAGSYDAERWSDFMQGIAPIPGSSKMAAGGRVAKPYPGYPDQNAGLMLWNVFTP